MLNRHRRKRVLNVRHRAVGSYICAASARGDESCWTHRRRENWSRVHPVYVTDGRLKRGGPAMLNKQRLHRQASKSLAWQGDDLFREGICTR